MKTQYERNMSLINSYDPWGGDPPDEYYESGRTVRDKGPGFKAYIGGIANENTARAECRIDYEEAT